MMSRQICNYQDKECGCQIYLEDDDHPEKCYYCGHFNAFHSGFTPTDASNFGACQKDSARCGCQGFVASLEDDSKCKYCDHYNAFYQQKQLMSSSQHYNNSINLLSQMPSNISLSNLSSAVANRQFLTPREEILAGFRPQNTTSLLLNPRQNSRQHNRTRQVVSRGRPKNPSLQINHILLFVDDSWNGLQPPRENSSKWNQLIEHGHIATNVLFHENVPDSINELIIETFSLNIQDNWIILNSSVSKLKLAVSQVIIMYNVYIIL